MNSNKLIDNCAVELYDLLKNYQVVFKCYLVVDRAKIKLEELYRQLEIAKLNYQQLGGVLKEDKIKMKEQQEHSRFAHDLPPLLSFFLTHSIPLLSLYIPKNIRKPLVF